MTTLREALRDASARTRRRERVRPSRRQRPGPHPEGGRVVDDEEGRAPTRADARYGTYESKELVAEPIVRYKNNHRVTFPLNQYTQRMCWR